MIWKGLSQQQAAWLLSGFAFLGMASTLMFGWYADRAHKPRLCALILFSAALAMLLPLYTSSFWLMALFTLLFAAVEATYTVGWAIAGDLFGRKHFAKIRGYMGLFYTWGGVLGPVMAGAVFDRWGTYQPLLWALIGVFAGAGIFFASLSNSWNRATGHARQEKK
jgi:MFS family permease